MDIEQLRYVVVAAREGSFAKAADRCFTTRQNVSRAIKNLEGELRISIFTRRGNSVALTPIGEVVMQQAQSVLDTVEGMKALGVSPSPDSKRMKLAVSLNVISGALPEVASLIVEHVVDNRILELSCKECYERVASRDIDVAVVTAMEREFPDCLTIKVASSPSYLMVGEQSPLAAMSHCALADLKGIDFVLMSDPEFQYGRLFELLGGLGFGEQCVSVCPSTSTMLHIIKRVDNTAALVTDTYAMSAPRGTTVIPIIDPRLNWNTYMLFWPNPERYNAIASFASRMRVILNRHKGSCSIKPGPEGL